MQATLWNCSQSHSVNIAVGNSEGPESDPQGQGKQPFDAATHVRGEPGSKDGNTKTATVAASSGCLHAAPPGTA